MAQKSKPWNQWGNQEHICIESYCQAHGFCVRFTSSLLKNSASSPAVIDMSQYCRSSPNPRQHKVPCSSGMFEEADNDLPHVASPGDDGSVRLWMWASVSHWTIRCKAAPVPQERGVQPERQAAGVGERRG
jgi:hypothetical protein